MLQADWSYPKNESEAEPPQFCMETKSQELIGSALKALGNAQQRGGRATAQALPQFSESASDFTVFNMVEQEAAAAGADKKWQLVGEAAVAKDQVGDP